MTPEAQYPALPWFEDSGDPLMLGLKETGGFQDATTMSYDAGAETFRGKVVNTTSVSRSA